MKSGRRGPCSKPIRLGEAGLPIVPTRYHAFQPRDRCKKLRARYSPRPIVVGWWGGTEAEPLARLRLDSLTQVGTTLTKTRQQVMQVPPIHTPPGDHPVPTVA